MDAKGVIDKILSDAQRQADNIKAEAAKEQAGHQAGHDQKLIEYKKQTEIIAGKAAEEKKSHLLAAARMDVAKELLAEKRSILDKVFDEAQTQLKGMEDDQYRRLMSRLMIEAVETGDEEVVVDKNDTRIGQDFIKKVNRELGPGFKGNLRLSNETQDIGAGFILRRGKINNNVSLKVLLDQARKDLEIELAKEVFGN